MKYVILLSCVAFLIACEEKPVKNEVVAEVVPEPIKTQRVITKDIPETLLTLNAALTEETDQVLMDNFLFGKFFCDRAEFYIVDQPTNKVHGSAIDEVTLYYLDGHLRQTKCILQEDIVSLLIGELGRFSIRPRDQKNKEIIDSGEIIKRTSKGPELNPELDNYEITWYLGERQVVYRARALDEMYVYTERATEFEYEYWNVQNRCI